MIKHKFFKTRTRVKLVAIPTLKNVQWIVEYRKWWQPSYHTLNAGPLPMFFFTKNAAFFAANNIERYI